jgi:hypothetical protein
MAEKRANRPHSIGKTTEMALGNILITDCYRILDNFTSSNDLMDFFMASVLENRLPHRDKRKSIQRIYVTANRETTFSPWFLLIKDLSRLALFA